MKIVVLDGKGVNPGDMSWSGIEQFGDLTVYERTAPDEVLSHVGDAEIALTNKTVFSADTIARLTNTKYIGVLATGYNVVDLEAASRHGIVVTNIPAYSTDSVAQHTFAHILNVTNQVDHYARASRDGEWSRCPDFCYWDSPLVELAGKNIGIVGLGHIGMKVAAIALYFGMNVYAYTSKSPDQLPQGIKKATMEGLLSISDIITLHAPALEDNYHMIDETAFSKMKDGVILVNCARGQLVDTEAMIRNLSNGKIGFAALDVIEKELGIYYKDLSGTIIDNPEMAILRSFYNVFFSPHTAFYTEEAVANMVENSILGIQAYLKGEDHPFIVKKY